MKTPIKQCVAVKAIIKQDGKVLVLKQSPEAAVENANRYHPPGGMVEPGESLHQALVREVNEETGLEVQIGAILAVEEWQANIRGEQCQFFGIFYACQTATGQVALDQDEAVGFAWIGAQDLASIDIIEPSLSVIKRALQA